VIDIDDTGYKFDVEIAGSPSESISKMKIFCYDLMLISFARQRGLGIDFLIHDSTIFGRRPADRSARLSHRRPSPGSSTAIQAANANRPWKRAYSSSVPKAWASRKSVGRSGSAPPLCSALSRSLQRLRHALKLAGLGKAFRVGAALQWLPSWSTQVAFPPWLCESTKRYHFGLWLS
jgi:hypothetical protein